MGTAPLACPSLKALCREKSFQVIAVVSSPDKPKGRDLKVQFQRIAQLQADLDEIKRAWTRIKLS